MTEPQHNRAWLLATAKGVAERLKNSSVGTQLRVRIPRAATATNTGGWGANLGDLGKGQPRLEVWLDRFSGYPDRKLYACFFTRVPRQLTTITKHVGRKLWPCRIIGKDDTEEERFVFLKERLTRSDFSKPILEKYALGYTFFGIYDPTRATSSRINEHFCSRAAAFFEDVARAMPNAKSADDHGDVYPRVENRKRVVSHLHRERSKLLALECKVRDNYECQACGFHFKDRYGRMGSDFAEAHHLVPLSRLRENVKTRIEDLVTVCANCHRMLHRMDGRREDIRKLRGAITRHS